MGARWFSVALGGPVPYSQRLSLPVKSVIAAIAHFTRSPAPTMTLAEARQRFGEDLMSREMLDDERQTEAFRRCLRVLSIIPKQPKLNLRQGSYRLKHLLERALGPDLYVYEGTLILAAKAAGFSFKSSRSRLEHFFNLILAN